MRLISFGEYHSVQGGAALPGNGGTLSRTADIIQVGVALWEVAKTILKDPNPNDATYGTTRALPGVDDSRGSAGDGVVPGDATRGARVDDPYGNPDRQRLPYELGLQINP